MKHGVIKVTGLKLFRQILETLFHNNYVGYEAQGSNTNIDNCFSYVEGVFHHYESI